MDTDVQRLVAALERKEQRMRRHLWIAAILWLVTALGVIEAHREIRDFRRHGLQTTGLEIRDDEGRLLTGLGRHPEGGRAYFKFVDEQERVRMFLALGEAGPALSFSDSEGRVRLRLAVGEQGGAIELLDESGRPAWSAP